MKRYGNLWHPIICFGNLLLAARKAQRGKRFRPNVLEFNDRLEANLLQLQQELKSHTKSASQNLLLRSKPIALTPPSPAVPAPLSQAWERGWG